MNDILRRFLTGLVQDKIFLSPTDRNSNKYYTMTAEEKQFHDAGGAETIEGLDERIMTMAREAPPFYKNPNLLTLYPLMIPGCIVPAVTLGFDSGMMNGLQSVPAWQECKYKILTFSPQGDPELSR